MNEELRSMWKNAVVAYFNVLPRHSPRGIEENTKNLRTVGDTAEIRTCQIKVGRQPPEPTCSVGFNKGWEFLDRMGDYQLLKPCTMETISGKLNIRIYGGKNAYPK
jgi:hypothetical protein